MTISMATANTPSLVISMATAITPSLASRVSVPQCLSASVYPSASVSQGRCQHSSSIALTTSAGSTDGSLTIGKARSQQTTSHTALHKPLDNLATQSTRAVQAEVSEWSVTVTSSGGLETAESLTQNHDLLTTLPTELLDQLCSVASPLSRVNLALTCQQLLGVAQGLSSKLALRRSVQHLRWMNQCCLNNAVFFRNGQAMKARQGYGLLALTLRDGSPLTLEHLSRLSQRKNDRGIRRATARAVLASAARSAQLMIQYRDRLFEILNKHASAVAAVAPTKASTVKDQDSNACLQTPQRSWQDNVVFGYSNTAQGGRDRVAYDASGCKHLPHSNHNVAATAAAEINQGYYIAVSTRQPVHSSYVMQHGCSRIGQGGRSSALHSPSRMTARPILIDDGPLTLRGSDGSWLYLKKRRCRII